MITVSLEDFEALATQVEINDSPSDFYPVCRALWIHAAKPSIRIGEFGEEPFRAGSIYQPGCMEGLLVCSGQRSKANGR